MTVKAKEWERDAVELILKYNHDELRPINLEITRLNALNTLQLVSRLSCNIGHTQYELIHCLSLYDDYKEAREALVANDASAYILSAQTLTDFENNKRLL